MNSFQDPKESNYYPKPYRRDQDIYIKLKSIAGITFIILFILSLFNLMVETNYNSQMSIAGQQLLGR
jgi:hypothetical protein